MKKKLATLHKLREMRRLTALSRVNEQDAAVAASAGVVSGVATQLKESMQSEQDHRRALKERAFRGTACAADMIYGRLYAEKLQSKTAEVLGQLLEAETLHRIEQDAARELRSLFNRADAEVQSITLAEERFEAEARRRAERREEDTIDDVSLTRFAARRTVA